VYLKKDGVDYVLGFVGPQSRASPIGALGATLGKEVRTMKVRVQSKYFINPEKTHLICFGSMSFFLPSKFCTS
jgi:hypothetical protein